MQPAVIARTALAGVACYRPPVGVRMGWRVDAMSALRGREVAPGIYPKTPATYRACRRNSPTSAATRDTLRTFDEAEKLLKGLKKSLKT